MISSCKVNNDALIIELAKLMRFTAHQMKIVSDENDRLTRLAIASETLIEIDKKFGELGLPVGNDNETS